MEAMQAAILLMPDANREALQTLLLFLNEVAANSETNQVNLHYYFVKNLCQKLREEIFSLEDLNLHLDQIVLKTCLDYL